MITRAINLLIICTFAFIPLFLGEKAREKSIGSAEDFILQGRRMKIFPMYATVFATWMSAFAFMGGVTYFFEEGPIYMTTVGWDMLFAVLFIVLGRRIWHYGKSGRYMTASDFFNDMYKSDMLTAIVTLVSIVCTMFYLQAQIIGAVVAIRVGTNGMISTYTGGIIFFSILVIYLWAGGLRAVAMADIFYGVLIVVAMISTGIFLMHTAGGTDEVFTRIIDMDPLNVSMSRDSGKERIMMWIALFIIVPIGAFMGPQMWLRNYASGSARNFLILPLLIGLSSIICVGTLFSGSAGIVLADDKVDSVAVIMNLLSDNANPFFYTFVAAGIFAAIFSTANSQVHALAAVYAIDVHKRYINSKMPDRKLVFMTKWAILACSCISYLLMIMVPQNIFDLSILGLGGMAQLIVPTAGAFFWKRSGATAAITGILSGEASFILMLILTEIHASICAAAALGINALLFLILSFASVENVSTYRRIASRRREYLSRDY